MIKSNFAEEIIGIAIHVFSKDTIIGIQSAIRTHFSVTDVHLTPRSKGSFQISVYTRLPDVLSQTQVDRISQFIKGYLYCLDPSIVFIQE